jgi:hypothetical protein
MKGMRNIHKHSKLVLQVDISNRIEYRISIQQTYKIFFNGIIYPIKYYSGDYYRGYFPVDP